MFTVTMVEVDQTVGNPDAKQVRQYPLATVDTLPHAHRIAGDKEVQISAATGGRVVTKLIDHGHAHEYGNVYRTTYVIITVKENGK